MSAIDVMPLSVSDYIADTQHLSNPQHGAYMLILMAMWRSKGWVSADDNTLANISKLSRAKWVKIAGPVRALLTQEADRVTQKRLLIEYENLQRKIHKAAINGSAGGTAKSLKQKEPGLANATQTPHQPGSTSLSLNLDSDSKVKQGEPARGKPANPKGTPFPADWQMGKPEYDVAEAKGFRGQYARNLFQKFRSHHVGKASMWTDWQAAWEYWVNSERPARGGQRAGGPTFAQIASGEAKLDHH